MGLLEPKKRNPKILICKHRLIARLSGSLRRGVCSCLLFFSQLLSTFSIISLFQMNEMFMYFSSKKKKKKTNKPKLSICLGFIIKQDTLKHIMCLWHNSLMNMYVQINHIIFHIFFFICIHVENILTYRLKNELYM